VDGLYLKGQPELGILTGVSLHGGLPGAWPAFGMRVGQIVPALVEHWRAFGRPAYAQFDNDPRFIGGLAKPDSIGPVIRLCLALNIVPVFAPPHEMGFQNAVEGFNGLWQDKVWGRFRDPTLDALQIRSGQWIHALRQRSAVRIEAAPVRDPFPSGPLEPWQPPKGRMVFLRRATEAGTVSVLGHHLLVDRHWPWRLVRAELDLTTSQISFFALRKREPIVQPLLSQAEYPIPDRWYR
jgi:hypothetical protein